MSSYEQIIKEWGIKTSVELWRSNPYDNTRYYQADPIDSIKSIIIQSKNRVNAQMQIMKIIDLI